MKYISFCQTIVLLLLVFLLPHNICSAENQTGGMPEISEAEMKQLEQQIEAEIDAFVSSLPPEQQEQFYRDVEALTEEMSKMSEEELNEFIDNVFAEPMQEAIPESQTTEPTQPAEPIKKIEKPQKKTPKKEINHIIMVLDEIAEHINNFLQKSETIVDFQQKIKKWAKAGFIPQWKINNISWADIQRMSIQLAQKMKSLSARDPKTKDYYFIKKLIDDKGLINNLELFNKKLSEELNIVVPELDISDKARLSLTKKSKQAIRTTIDAILEAYNLLKLPEAIDRLIDSFGTIAEAIKKEEDKAVKNAMNALKKKHFPAKVTLLGQPEGTVYTGPTYQKSQDYEYQIPTYDRPYINKENNKYSPLIKEEKTATKPKPKQNLKKVAPTKSKSPSNATIPKSPAEERASNHIEKIELSLEDARDAIEEITHENGFPQILTETSKTGPKETIIDSLSTLQSSIKNATTAIRSFNTSIKSLPATIKNRLANQVKKSIKAPLDNIKKFKKELEKVAGKATNYPMADKVTVSIGSLERAIGKIVEK